MWLVYVGHLGREELPKIYAPCIGFMLGLASLASTELGFIRLCSLRSLRSGHAGSKSR